TLFSCLKGRGFNLENTRLTDPRRVKKLIAVLAISFCWCYLTGEWQHDQKKAIKIKKHIQDYALRWEIETLFSCLNMIKKKR
ncbi:hypothetical protein J458_4346, partial [Acinetobacter baumannii 987421]